MRGSWAAIRLKSIPEQACSELIRRGVTHCPKELGWQRTVQRVSNGPEKFRFGVLDEIIRSHSVSAGIEDPLLDREGGENELIQDCVDLV